METLTHKVKFKVSLSNGQTFYEGKAPFNDIPGENSPWQRLIKYTVDNKCHITSLSLFTEYPDGKTNQTFNLPSLGKNPKFREFSLKEDKPIDFQVSRKMAREADVVGNEVSNVAISEWYTIAEAIYPTYTLQLWVDELNPKNCWVLVV